MKIEVSIDVTNVAHVEALNVFTRALGGHNHEHSQILGDVTLVPKTLIKEAEEPKAETPKKLRGKKAEETKAEEPKAEETKAEEPKAEEPKAEEPKAEEPKAEAITLEDVRAIAAQLCAEDEDNRPLILNKVFELSNGETRKLPQLSPVHFPAFMNFLKTLQNG